MSGTPSAHEPPATNGPADLRPETTWTLHFGSGPEWSPTQLGLVVAHVAAVVTYLGALSAATGALDQVFWLFALVPVVTMPWAGSGAPLGLWGLLVMTWFGLTPTGAFSWWSLLGALAVALGHAATALAATGPTASRFDRATLGRWTLHTAVAAGAAAPVALLTGALSASDHGLGKVATIVGLLGLAGGIWLVRTSPPARLD